MNGGKMGKTIDLKQLAVAKFPDKVAALRLLFGFTQEEFAKCLNVNEKTIRRWESDEVEPHAQNKQAVQALMTIAEALGDLFEPDVIKVWVDRENPALNGERPRDFVKKPGGIFIVANLLGTVGR